MSNQINFYYMNGCGYCKKAKHMLENDISNKNIVIKETSDAPKGVRGFPHFTYKDKSFSGAPPSKEKLFDELGFNDSIENYIKPGSDEWMGVTKEHYYKNKENDNQSWFGVL